MLQSRTHPPGRALPAHAHGRKLQIFGGLRSLLPRSPWAPLAETALITVVPDDNAAFVALQLATGLAAGAGSVVLVGSAFLFSLLQGEV